MLVSDAAPRAVNGTGVLHMGCEEYMKLLQTLSDHRALPEPNKSRFFEAIGRVITQMGGEVIRDYETLAVLAKKG